MLEEQQPSMENQSDVTEENETDIVEGDEDTVVNDEAAESEEESEFGFQMGLQTCQTSFCRF